MSVFSDDDLKRLKECLAGEKDHMHPTGDCFAEIGNPNWISPLLARLYAAESIVSRWDEDILVENNLFNTWLRAAGKEKGE